MAYAAPVAAPRVIKEVADKDRRSRMAYSTYHQEPKKGGAGGAYTWGTAGDVFLVRMLGRRVQLLHVLQHFTLSLRCLHLFTCPELKCSDKKIATACSTEAGLRSDNSASN